MCDQRRSNWVLCFALFGIWIGACEKDSAVRDDARRFLAAHETIRYDSPAKQRAERVEALSRVPLGDAVVREVRDVCVTAHRALLHEEQSQEANARLIEQALAGTPGGAPMDALTLDKLRRGIGDSEVALSRAKDQLRTCEDRARSLGLRFGRR